MKTFGVICTCIAFSFLFSTCEKQEDTNPLSNSDSTMLKTFALLIPNQSPLDTANKFNYSYDANKRLTVIASYSGYNSVTTFGSYSTIHFFYNGNNDLPYKTATISGNMNPRDTAYTDTAYYFYSNGRLIMDSVIHYQPVSAGNGVIVFLRTNYDSQRYTYNGNNISALTDNWVFGFGQVRATVNILVTQNSPTSLTIERQRTPLGNPVTTIQRYRVVYDDKPNSLFGLSSPRPGYGLLHLGFVYRNSFPNNVIEFEKIFDSGSSSQWYDKFEYSFRADNYPLTGTHYDMTNNFPPYYRKGLYMYY